MTDEKRTINCDMTALDWLRERIAKAKFCTQECPVPQNERNCSCGCRPLAYMKECPTLRRYNKRIKKEE